MTATGAKSATAARQAPFVLPPELTGSVPRDVRLTAGGMTLAVVAVLCALGAIVSTIVMSIEVVRGSEQQLVRANEAVAAEAEVVNVRLRRGEHPRRVVTYRYDVNGQSYAETATLRQRDGRPVTTGSVIPIRYLRSKPHESWIAGYEPDTFPAFVIPIVCLGLLSIAGTMVWGLRRQWTLLFEGRAAAARITATKKMQTDKTKMFRVNYEFRTLSGAKHTGRCDMTKEPPPVGGFLPVVYHRDTPTWNAVYPLQLVRPMRVGMPSQRASRTSPY